MFVFFLIAFQAMSNILVLAREEAGAQKIFETGGIEKLNTMLDNQDKDLRLNAIRALSSITKHSKLRVSFWLKKENLTNEVYVNKAKTNLS